MERQALSYRLSESEQSSLIQQAEFNLRFLTRNKSSAWFLEHLADHLSSVSQQLCGVRPYQWDAMDRERT